MKQSNFRLWASRALTVGMYGAILWWCYVTEVSTTVRADHWRYIHIIEQYYAHGLLDADLLFRHGEHLQLLYNCWFLANGLWFGLNTRLELFAGIAFLGLAAWMLRALLIDANGQNLASKRESFNYLLLLSVLFSFHQIQSFAYSLLAFVAFAELILLFWYLHFLLTFLREGKLSSSQWFAMGLVFFSLSVGVAGGGWICYWAASLVIVAHWTIRNRKSNDHTYIPMIWILAFAIPIFLVNQLSPEISRREPIFTEVSYLLQHASETARYMLVLLGNTVASYETLERRGYVGIANALGLFFGFSYIAALGIYMRFKLWERSYIPLFLLLTYLFIAAALVLFRFPVFGVDNAAAPRYATGLQIGLLGVIWTFILAIDLLDVKFAKYASGVLGCSVAGLYLFHVAVSYSVIPFYRKFEIDAIQTIANGDFSKRSVICPHEQLCKEGTPVLRSNALNVYRDAK